MDLGSRGVKIAYRGSDHSDKPILRSYDTFQFYQEYAKKSDDGLVIDYDKLNLPHDKIVSTGYGHLTIATKGGVTISEIKAHSLGAMYQTGLSSFTLVDLGGQDSKVVAIKNGRIVDFNLNDKCGAGSGRYLENMATILSMSLEEAGNCYDDPTDISSTCAVFGESELIGLIIEGHSKKSLMAGVNRSIVKRVSAILSEFDDDTIVFTGGLGRSSAIRHFLGDMTGKRIIVPEYFRHNGAIGSLIYGEGYKGEI